VDGDRRVAQLGGERVRLLVVDVGDRDARAAFHQRTGRGLAEPGGSARYECAGMLVDDLTNWFPGVLKDWTEFIADHSLTPVITEGEKALVIKP
jgi:hypothetical protein